MKSAVFKVVVDSALAYSVVFIWVFNDWLLEISAEVQDLRKKFKNLFINLKKLRAFKMARSIKEGRVILSIIIKFEPPQGIV